MFINIIITQPVGANLCVRPNNVFAKTMCSPKYKYIDVYSYLLGQTRRSAPTDDNESENENDNDVLFTKNDLFTIKCIIFPLCRIRCNVLGNDIMRFMITNYMFIIITLP